MTLALGDALAVALMEHRRFTPEDFRGLHPGGRLGARLAKVGDLMHSGEEMPLIGPDAPMGEALIEMSRKGFGVVGVVDAGALIGIITDGDLRRHMAGLLDQQVAGLGDPVLAGEEHRRLREPRVGMVNGAREQVARHLGVEREERADGFEPYS